LDDEEEEEDDGLVHGRRKRKVAFMPSLGEWLGRGHPPRIKYSTDTTHTIYYRGHWLRVRKWGFIE
jgi:chaperone BCS1